MTGLHAVGAWVAIGLTGVTGLWGLVLAGIKRQPGRMYVTAGFAAIGVMLLQGAAGLVLFAGDREPGSGHLFYGMVIAAAVAFGYIYRSQLGKRASLSWGLFLLFLMGSGFRAVANVGESLGG